MNILEISPELWRQEAIPTEYAAFQALSSEPLGARVTYIAAPWSVLINKNKSFFKRPHPRRIANGFTICQHISYEQYIPFWRVMGIKTLFTPHVHKNHDEMRILPFPHHAINGTEPERKDIECSFIGCLITHPVRKQLWDLFKSSMYLVKRPAWHYELRERRKHELEYKTILARSRYSLCPRGTGASTIRFWESLQAGAIPILISNAMRLPQGWDWADTIVRVREEDVKVIPAILRSVSASQEEKMYRNCLRAYEEFSGPNIVSNVRLHFDGQPQEPAKNIKKIKEHEDISCDSDLRPNAPDEKDGQVVPGT